MYLVANRKNLKLYAKELLGNEYTEEKEKELINICTNKHWKDYHKGGHWSFAVNKWLEEIDEILRTHGVESIDTIEFKPEMSMYDDDRYISYCNTGDAYSITIMYYKNKLRISDWGSIVESIV